MKKWSNLAKVVYKRTYARKDNGVLEKWDDTVERVIRGNTEGFNVDPKEIDRLRYFMMARKAMPAGRGLWFSGAPAQKRLGETATINCWFLTSDTPENFVMAQDLLMLGGGVGMSVEHRFTSKLPKVRKDVRIVHQNTKDADFIVPDTREGWCELTRRVLDSLLVTGRSFSYSTICVRGQGEDIKGFGGRASGPIPLIDFVTKIVKLLQSREGKFVRPIDAADLICAIGEMVVAGNLRRSALILLGDAWDKEYLKAKRWDLGQIPTQRAMANFSIVCDDIEDVHPLFWKTYEQGEPFGIVNRKNIQKYGRTGELKKDSAIGCNPCMSYDTYLHTNNGLEQIGDLVGQNREIWDGEKWVEINTFRVTGHKQPLLIIEFHDGSFLRLTPKHQCYLDDSTPILAENLSEGHCLEKSKLLTYRHGNIKSDAAYLKGFLIGDGQENPNEKPMVYLYYPKTICQQRLIESAKEVGERIYRTNCIQEFGFIDQPGNQRFEMTGLSTIKNELKGWGKEYKDGLPKEIYRWDLLSKLEFIAGYMDADGTASDTKNGFMYQVASISKQLLLDFQLLLKSIGVMSAVRLTKKGTWKEIKGKVYYCQDLYRLTVSQKASIVLSQQVKFSRLTSFANKTTTYNPVNRYNTIRSIRLQDHLEDTVYCCTMPTTHKVLVGNGLQLGQCGEIPLEDGEACNLSEICLPNFDDFEEIKEAAKLMHRYGKRVCMGKYHHKKSADVIKKNMRIGSGLTGCLQSQFFTPEHLDELYKIVQDENVSSSKEYGVNESIRTTTFKPSGTLSLLCDTDCAGIHAAYSRYIIRRVRFSAQDPLIPLLKAAGHHIEPVERFDGSKDHNTLVVDFYRYAGPNTPVADEGFDTWKQLDTLLMAQKHWSDQSVSVTVYYKKEEIPQIKEWLANNLQYLKTISFLCHNDHGFKQAPLEAITESEYDKYASKVKDLNFDDIQDGDMESQECAGGACPVK